MRTRSAVLGCMIVGLAALPLACRGDGAQVGSYREKVEARQANPNPSRLSEADRNTVAEAAEEIEATMPDPGLEVGQEAPDFSLTNAAGRTITLSEELEFGPVVLVFYRGGWCPYCNMHLQSFQESLPAIRAEGASVLAVSPQKPEKSVDLLTAQPMGFELLSDLDGSAMKAYHLYFEVPPELWKLYRDKFGLDLAEYNGPDRYVLPVPGTFVIDRTGTIRFAEADTDYKKRTEPADILAALKRLKTEAD